MIHSRSGRTRVPAPPYLKEGYWLGEGIYLHCRPIWPIDEWTAEEACPSGHLIKKAFY